MLLLSPDNSHHYRRWKTVSERCLFYAKPSLNDTYEALLKVRGFPGPGGMKGISDLRRLSFLSQDYKKFEDLKKKSYLFCSHVNCRDARFTSLNICMKHIELYHGGLFSRTKMTMYYNREHF